MAHRRTTLRTGFRWMSSAGSRTGRPARAAAAKQEDEDVKLLEQLLTACNGNYSRTVVLADPRPIRTILASGVPIEEIINTIRYKVDRRSYPKNQTIGSWSEPWFLICRAIREKGAGAASCGEMAIPPCR
jgi:hypothetical protein